MRLFQDPFAQVGAQALLGDDIHFATQNFLKFQLEPSKVRQIQARSPDNA